MQIAFQLEIKRIRVRADPFAEVERIQYRHILLRQFEVENIGVIDDSLLVG